MTEAAKARPPEPRAGHADLPDASIERSPRAWTWAWLLTLAALVVAGTLVYQARQTKGPVVRVRFDSAYGLRPGDPVAFRGLQIGEVDQIRLDTRLDGVVVRASIRPDAAGVAVEGSRWWIVRPEIGFRRIAGLETLLGPRYLEVDPGPADARRVRRFDGLEGAPSIDDIQPGALELVLLAPRRGSLEAGSPVHYRDVRVGFVRAFELSDDGTRVRVSVVIEPQHAHLVRDRSRFWNASGIGVDWGIFGGLSVRTESLETVLGGGIGFATPDRPGEPVQDGHVFELADDAQEAWLEWDPDLSPPDAGEPE